MKLLLIFFVYFVAIAPPKKYPRKYDTTDSEKKMGSFLFNLVKQCTLEDEETEEMCENPENYANSASNLILNLLNLLKTLKILNSLQILKILQTFKMK